MSFSHFVASRITNKNIFDTDWIYKAYSESTSSLGDFLYNFFPFQAWSWLGSGTGLASKWVWKYCWHHSIAWIPAYAEATLIEFSGDWVTGEPQSKIFLQNLNIEAELTMKKYKIQNQSPKISHACVPWHMHGRKIFSASPQIANPQILGLLPQSQISNFWGVPIRKSQIRKFCND